MMIIWYKVEWIDAGAGGVDFILTRWPGKMSTLAAPTGPLPLLARFTGSAGVPLRADRMDTAAAAEVAPYA